MAHELTSHAGLANRNAHSSLEFSAGVAWLHVARLRDDNVLARIELVGAVTLVLGFLDGSFSVAVVEVGNDAGVQVLNSLLQWG